MRLIPGLRQRALDPAIGFGGLGQVPADAFHARQVFFHERRRGEIRHGPCVPARRAHVLGRDVLRPDQHPAGKAELQPEQGIEHLLYITTASFLQCAFDVTHSEVHRQRWEAAVEKLSDLAEQVL